MLRIYLNEPFYFIRWRPIIAAFIRWQKKDGDESGSNVVPAENCWYYKQLTTISRMSGIVAPCTKSVIRQPITTRHSARSEPNLSSIIVNASSSVCANGGLDFRC